MKIISSIIIICFLLVTVFLVASSAGDERSSYSNSLLSLKFKVSHPIR